MFVTWMTIIASQFYIIDSLSLVKCYLGGCLVVFRAFFLLSEFIVFRDINVFFSFLFSLKLHSL